MIRLLCFWLAGVDLPQSGQKQLSLMQDGVMYVHGGYDGKDAFGDTWALKTADWSWHQVQTGIQDAPPLPSLCMLVFFCI